MYVMHSSGEISPAVPIVTVARLSERCVDSFGESNKGKGSKAAFTS